MDFRLIHSEDDLSVVVRVLTMAHATVAKEFGFTKDTNPTNNAFIDISTLTSQLSREISLYGLTDNHIMVGCIAIEKSSKKSGTYYIEKVSVLPEYRNRGYGALMMERAAVIIKESGGLEISLALINSHTKLKNWYSSMGFMETGTKDFDHLPFRVCFMSKRI